MIDFEAIPKRVCLDRKLRQEFLLDPVKITEQLLNESHTAFALTFPGVRPWRSVMSRAVQPAPDEDVSACTLP